MKKCRPVVKGPSGGTLLFCFALPVRGASAYQEDADYVLILCLGAACTGCIMYRRGNSYARRALPRRCLHGVHHKDQQKAWDIMDLCLGAACTGCIDISRQIAAHHFVAYAVSR